MDALKAIILAQSEQNARLEALIAALRQAMFGRKSEKIDPDQFELALEDIEAGIAVVEAEGEANELVTPTQTSWPRKTNRGSRCSVWRLRTGYGSSKCRSRRR